MSRRNGRKQWQGLYLEEDGKAIKMKKNLSLDLISKIDGQFKVKENY